MRNRSPSTLDRDHQRSIDHRAKRLLLELNMADWNTVELYEIEEFLNELEEICGICEDPDICEGLESLIQKLHELCE